MTDPVFDPQLNAEEAGEKIVTFLDFVQALAIRRLRNEWHLPLQKIREGYYRAKKDFKLKYPFATTGVRVGLFGPDQPDQGDGVVRRRPPRRAGLFGSADKEDKHVLVLCFDDGNNGFDRYVQLTGKKHGNQLFAEIALTYTRLLEYDPTTALPIALRMATSSWTPTFVLASRTSNSADTRHTLAATAARSRLARRPRRSKDLPNYGCAKRRDISGRKLHPARPALSTKATRPA